MSPSTPLIIFLSDLPWGQTLDFNHLRHGMLNFSTWACVAPPKGLPSKPRFSARPPSACYRFSRPSLHAAHGRGQHLSFTGTCLACQDFRWTKFRSAGVQTLITPMGKGSEALGASTLYCLHTPYHMPSRTHTKLGHPRLHARYASTKGGQNVSAIISPSRTWNS